MDVNTRSQVINRHDMERIVLEYSSISTQRVEYEYMF